MAGAVKRKDSVGVQMKQEHGGVCSHGVCSTNNTAGIPICVKSPSRLLDELCGARALSPLLPLSPHRPNALIVLPMHGGEQCPALARNPQLPLQPMTHPKDAPPHKQARAHARTPTNIHHTQVVADAACAS